MNPTPSASVARRSASRAARGQTLTSKHFSLNPARTASKSKPDPDHATVGRRRSTRLTAHTDRIDSARRATLVTAPSGQLISTVLL